MLYVTLKFILLKFVTPKIKNDKTQILQGF